MREATNKVIEMIDEQILDPKDVVMMCLKWMSEDDVKDMCRVYEIDWEDNDESELFEEE